MASKEALKGVSCEMLVASRLCEQGWIPYLPLVDGSPIDILVETNKGFQKIQVKAWVLKANSRVRLERSGNKDNKRKRSYSTEEIDWFAVVRMEEREVFIVPVIDGRASINISDIQQYQEAWDLLGR